MASSVAHVLIVTPVILLLDQHREMKKEGNLADELVTENSAGIGGSRFERSTKELSDNKSSKRFFNVYLAAVAFVLNWIWEVAQISAYETAEKSIVESLIFCTLASVVDVLAILVIYGVTAFLFRRHDWKFYLITALFGALIAVLFEKIALTFGWWSYREQMTTVPLLGTGLLPFMQLVLLTPVAIWIAGKMAQNTEK